MTKYDWSLRCHECGLSVTGHGRIPEHGEYWICDQCRHQHLDCALGT